MSLLSKLFGGDKKAEKAAKDLLNGLFSQASSAVRTTGTPQASGEDAAESAPQERTAPSGIPAEENQYSFNGTYIEYFNKVFTEDFADYDITYEAVAGRSTPATVFHFAKGGARVLTVELMSERSDAQGTKIQCRKNGIKYLRFYYDHHGWWNARSYVTNRVRGEL